MNKLDDDTRELLKDSKLVQDIRHQLAEEHHWEAEKQQWKREKFWWIIQSILVTIVAISAAVTLSLQYYATIVR